MQNLLIFLLISAIFCAGYIGFIKTLWAMMQDGGAFDIAFKWNKLRDRLYAGKPWQQLLENALGGCEQCTSFWWSLPWFVIYEIFCHGIGYWVLNAPCSCIWFIGYCCINAMLGLWILKPKSNV